MASERIGDWTKEELKAYILEVIEERLQQGFSYTQESDNRSPKEVFESIQKNRLKRKPGQPSTLQMLREDRDR
ncbi:MAG: hypothetical protein HZC41_06465 [Chloroflexi bacterium]|nr:hypothetical protein [Chloroflexota bacterium]